MVPDDEVRRLVFTSGNVFHDLMAESDALHKDGKSEKAGGVAICRVEQYCPFPYDLVGEQMKKYPNVRGH